MLKNAGIVIIIRVISTGSRFENDFLITNFTILNVFMDENEGANNLKKSSVISTFSLFFQSGYSAVLGLGANLVLTVVLSPTIFGIYITVLSIIALLNYFSDIGLAASLVQKKEITDEDLASTFTVQQVMIVTIISIGFFATNFIKDFYKLPPEGIYLYWALLFSFFLSSLKTIPSILLERKVQFQKIVFVGVVENTVFYIAVIILGLLGFSLQSFTIAVLLRSIVGVVLIYSISFWMPRFGITKKNLQQLLSFGLPFQANSFLALFKDDLITLYLGKVLGFEALGYIGWAKKWAEAPIRIIMDNISRVLFPVLSRIQNDKEKVSRLIEKILLYQTLVLAPVMIGMALTMNMFVMIMPKYGKWLPALPLFYLLSFAAFLSSYSSPFTNLFNALGKVKISFFFMIFWTVSTWILTPILSKMFGYFGFPLVQLILSFAFIAVVFKAKQIIPFSFIKSVYQGILSALIMGLVIFSIKFNFQINIFTFITSIVIGGLVYMTSIRFIFKVDIINELKKLFVYD